MDHNVCYISDPRLLEECSKIPNIGKRVRFDYIENTIISTRFLFQTNVSMFTAF